MHIHSDMMRIEKYQQQGDAVFAVSGRINQARVPELQSLLEMQGENEITLDLEELRLVDREAVKFLAACEARGVKLINCSSYIREWIGKGSDSHEYQSMQGRNLP